MRTYYHGGIGGKVAGDVLVPSPPHVNDGCPVCVARGDGRVCTVGEYRRWAQQFGARGRPVLDALADAEDWEPMDPPSAERAVYVTTDHGYARYYAALRGHGDLYRVEPIGAVARSNEDSFPSWTCAGARVVSVVERGVTLRRRDRRELRRRWAKADKHKAARQIEGAPHAG